MTHDAKFTTLQLITFLPSISTLNLRVLKPLSFYWHWSRPLEFPPRPSYLNKPTFDVDVQQKCSPNEISLLSSLLLLSSPLLALPFFGCSIIFNHEGGRAAAESELELGALFRGKRAYLCSPSFPILFLSRVPLPTIRGSGSGSWG